MLIPFGIFVVNGIRLWVIYALHLSEEPLYILASGSPFLFYLLEVVAIVLVTLFLLWIWQRYGTKTNWWLVPVFFLGVIGAGFMGMTISNLSDISGLQYRNKECGTYLSTAFEIAADRQDVSFCTSPHDYALVNTYKGIKGEDLCRLPGGNTVHIARDFSNKYDPFFSKYCVNALSVHAKQPNLCFEMKSGAGTNDIRDNVVDCVENYAGKNNDIASCELLTRDERNHCIFYVALWGTQSIKTCEAIDTDSKWRNNCLERMADGKP